MIKNVLTKLTTGALLFTLVIIGCQNVNDLAENPDTEIQNNQAITGQYIVVMIRL